MANPPITKEALAEKLELHTKWLRDEEGGVRANLRGANLRGADLSEANLSWANLSGADLSEADLRGADLYRTGGATVQVGAHPGIIYPDGRMRYGCKELTLDGWDARHEELAKEHHPDDVEYYSRITKALVALARAAQVGVKEASRG